MTISQPSIALIGGGPRGASLLERFAAHLSHGSEQFPLTIHVIDDMESGAGSVWRTDQTRELCMNTLSDAVTLFTEATSSVSGPTAPGPTLYEWSLLALAEIDDSEELAVQVGAIPEDRRSPYYEFPARPGFATDFRDELTATLPESHPSRALYGEYLRWCYDRAARSLPDSVSIVRHRTRALAITHISGIEGDEIGGERITLADGSFITAHAVILATGWLPRSLTPAEEVLAHQLEDRRDLTWVRPASPIEQDLSAIPANENVIVRGLGMGFFDTMALLTLGRGGRFESDSEAAGGLRYVPSGAEPVMHVTSRRGVPFRAKSLYHSLPPRAAQRYLRAVAWEGVSRPLDFDRLFWPRVVADAMFDYLDTLVRLRPEAVIDSSGAFDAIDATLTDLLELPTTPAVHEVPSMFEAALAPHFVDPADQFLLSVELDPVSTSFPGGTTETSAYQRWVKNRVAEDLEEGALGRDSALKAGLWSISAARGFASRVGSFGGFDAESRVSGFATLFAVGGMVGSGPPAFRNAQLLALLDSGLVRFIGPDAAVAVTDEGFTAESAAVAGSRVSGPALIDAWMHSTNVSATTDPLTRSLVDSGRARAFTVASRTGLSNASYTTRSFDVDEATGLIIRAEGEIDRAIHAAGIPVDDTVHDTIISPMPGTDPTMLRETDRIAASALRIAAAARVPANAKL